MNSFDTLGDVGDRGYAIGGRGVVWVGSAGKRGALSIRADSIIAVDDCFANPNNNQHQNHNSTGEPAGEEASIGDNLVNNLFEILHATELIGLYTAKSLLFSYNRSQINVSIARVTIFAWWWR